MCFDGKVAMITGAARGIGKSTALRLASEGAMVVLCDLNGEGVEAVAAEIRAAGGKAVAGKADVKERDQIQAIVDLAHREFGPVDILVNVAGGSAALINKLSLFEDADLDTLDWVIDINLRGTIICIKSVLDDMIAKKKGKIVNIASIAGVCGIIDRVDYSAAKGGVIALTQALAMEIGRHNINVNCVSPGAIHRGDGPIRGDMTYLGENGHEGTADDCANLIRFLVSEESDFITGQNYIIDGGRLLGPCTQRKINP